MDDVVKNPFYFTDKSGDYISYGIKDFLPKVTYRVRMNPDCNICGNTIIETEIRKTLKKDSFCQVILLIKYLLEL